jgi:hypothetical protein
MEKQNIGFFFQIKTLFYVKIPSKIIKENILHN